MSDGLEVFPPLGPSAAAITAEIAAAILAQRQSILYADPFMWRQPLAGTIPPEIDINNTRLFDFANAVTSSVLGHWRIPSDADLTVAPTIAAEFAVSLLGAGDANVRWQCTTKYVAITGVLSGTQETLLVTSPVTNAIDQLHGLTLTLNPALIPLGGLVTATLSRLGADAADTFTGRVAVVQMSQLRYRR